MNDSINKIKDYFVSMEMYEGRWVISVKYQPKWGAYSSEDGRISVVEDDNHADVWWYCAKDDDVTVDDIIELICETVQTNLEAIKKVELFKLKASELKQLFSDEKISLSKLQTLKFVFEDGPVDKPITKKDLITHVDETIKEHDVFKPTTDTAEKVKRARKSEKKQRTTSQIVTATPKDLTQEEINDLRG
jgi:hypothetical protein